ncbi:hypothetical protein ES707_13284 [subsurface metagenome]
MKKKERRTKKIVILWVMLAGILTLAVLFLSGCTTSYRITTDPSGAKVTVDGELMGTTPCTFSLSDPVDAMMVIRKEGYEEIQEPLITEVSFENRLYPTCEVYLFVSSSPGHCSPGVNPSHYKPQKKMVIYELLGFTLGQVNLEKIIE